MTLEAPCALCCSACLTHMHTHRTTHTITHNPSALANLIPAGTIQMKRAVQDEPLLCDHVHAEDGWHVFSGVWYSIYLRDESASFCKELGFLVKHQFVSITYTIAGDNKFILRIYLIPADLSGVRGRLHHANRKGATLSMARRYLRKVIPQISRDQNQWRGLSCTSESLSNTLINSPPDARTLSEIYSDLSSPVVDLSRSRNEIVTRLLDYNDNLEGFGLRSMLYRYQRRSIATMVSRELDLQDTPDPLFVEVEDMNGARFYFQPGTMEIVKQRGMVAPTRGGLLCEELGTGKTIMILGLILATRKQIPDPPETFSGPPPLLTPLALRNFPSAPFSSIRSQFLPPILCPDQPESRVPSLVEVLLHCARTIPEVSIPNLSTSGGRQQYERQQMFEEQLGLTPLGDLVQKNVPFYPCYANEGETILSRPKRNKTCARPRFMYLSSATLVVVPSNLLSQWDREVTKHCEYPLRVLILRTTSKIPPIKSLAVDYDIILMTYNRYTAEATRKNIANLYSSSPCLCPTIEGSRVPDCQCPDIPGVSPLLQIRWKRLVIDEGHVSASLSTHLTPFTKLLSVERRWIVTGTPTTNLLGLKLGRNSISESVYNPEDDNISLEDVLKFQLEYPDFDFTEEESTNSMDTSAPEVSQRIWNNHDRMDLYKMDNMITHFVAVPHFIANSKLMQTHVREPLMDRHGPRPGSIQVLNQVMEMVMIRHRVEDVEEDIILPSVNHESVLLDLDPVVIKSYNALQATIAINAIDSQRTDQDYMFHPRNTDSLQLTVKNMSQLMFWSVDEGMYNVDQLVKNAEKTLELAMSRNMVPEDIQLCQEAFKHISIAATDMLWRRVQTHEDVPYRVYNMPQSIYETWTRTEGPVDISVDSDTSMKGYMHADRLLKMRDLIMSRPLMSEDLIIQKGHETVQEDMKIRKAFEESYRRSKGKNNRKYTATVDEAHAEFVVENAAKKATALDTLKEMQKELNNSLAKLEGEEVPESEGIPDSDKNAALNASAPSRLLSSSILANVTVGSSASSKLTYIMNEVVKYSGREKILIFSDSELTLAHISEALELIHVKFLRFTTQIQPQVREQLVLTFETSETYRVFLMELKHGARGLNLTSASRVIFCEPVWQADVESQAIKRVHRIGQTKNISVKTLAIRGTAEENMVERRNHFKNSHDKIPKLLDESGMRHFIANPKFLSPNPERLPTIHFPFIDIPPSLPTPSLLPHSPSSASTSQKRVIADDYLDIVDSTNGASDVSPPKKKKKTVHFG